MRGLLWTPSGDTYWRDLSFLHNLGVCEVEKVALNYYLKDSALLWWKALTQARRLFTESTIQALSTPISWSRLVSERKVLQHRKNIGTEHDVGTTATRIRLCLKKNGVYSHKEHRGCEG